MSPTVERSPGASLSPPQRSDIRKKDHMTEPIVPPTRSPMPKLISHRPRLGRNMWHNAGVVEYILRYLMVWYFPATSCRVVPKMFLSAKEKESQHLRLFLTFSRCTYSNFEKTFVKKNAWCIDSPKFGRNPIMFFSFPPPPRISYRM